MVSIRFAMEVIGASSGDGVAVAGGIAPGAMYKPKSLASDVQFAALLDELNPFLEKQLRHFRVLDRADYGWAEVVRFQPCSRPEEVDDYYERLGSILAIHYALGATDVHFENLIACGDTPIVVDTETIIQRPPPRPADDDWAYWNWHHIMSTMSMRSLRICRPAIVPLPAK